jgi:iron complex transport system substrate-binding protein
VSNRAARVTLLCCLLCLCAPRGAGGARAQNWDDLRVDHSMVLRYAQNFSVDYYEDGGALITIAGGGRYLVVPEGQKKPAGLAADIIVLQRPIDHIYLVATSSMDLFAGLDALDSISLSGTRADDWHVAAAKAAMDAGGILYAGKYSAPDYELIVSRGCDLAIESTMIYHTPEVEEKLEEFGIPVLVERSSYEPHPLGRTEWIRLYAVLLGKEDLAATLLDAQSARLASLAGGHSSEKTAAFFYITSAGYVNVRKSGDYVSQMIALAGGRYIFDDLGDGDSALSTVNMQMEEFYAAARDADILIYNSTIDGEVPTLDAFLAKSPLLANFKAVQTGNVWCTTRSMFQETLHLGDMIADLHAVIAGEASNPPTYLYRLT